MLGVPEGAGRARKAEDGAVPLPEVSLDVDLPESALVLDGRGPRERGSGVLGKIGSSPGRSPSSCRTGSSSPLASLTKVKTRFSCSGVGTDSEEAVRDVSALSSR